MIATLVHENHISWVSTETNIYRLDEPFQGHDHIAVSRHEVEYGQWQNAGTEVVGCREDGGIDGDEVIAVYRTYEVLSFADALTRIGYSLEEN